MKKVYVVMLNWCDGYAMNCYGTDPFHNEVLRIYSSKDSADKAAIECAKEYPNDIVFVKEYDLLD